MKVVFDRSFLKSLDKLNNKAIKKQLEKLILTAEAAENIFDIKNIRKMEGFKTFYRMRIGDYRVGIELENDTLRFIVIAHRKDIYKLFP